MILLDTDHLTVLGFPESARCKAFNARLQAEASRLGQGEIVFLNAEEAQSATQTNRGQHGRPWELWRARALGTR